MQYPKAIKKKKKKRKTTQSSLPLSPNSTPTLLLSLLSNLPASPLNLSFSKRNLVNSYCQLVSDEADNESGCGIGWLGAGRWER